MIYVQWIGFLTLFRKETIRIFRIWMQTLLPSVMTTALYYLIFGHVIGTRIGPIHQFTYIQFIVPGLVMMAVITNAYTNVVSSVFSAKFQRQIEELLVSPLSDSVILCGYLSGGILRSCLVGLLVLGISLFFCPLSILHPWLVVISMLLTSILFSLLGFLNAVFAKKFDDITIVPTFILTPMTYLGGVFYSIDLLPSFFHHLSLFNPILYLVNLFRFALIGVTDISVKAAFGMMLVLIVILWSGCFYTLRKGIGFRH